VLQFKLAPLAFMRTVNVSLHPYLLNEFQVVAWMPLVLTGLCLCVWSVWRRRLRCCIRCSSQSSLHRVWWTFVDKLRRWGVFCIRWLAVAGRWSQKHRSPDCRLLRLNVVCVCFCMNGFVSFHTVWNYKLTAVILFPVWSA